MDSLRYGLISALLILGTSDLIQAETYSVGPDQVLSHPGHVPWNDLNPGDVVEIHWRPEAYRYKWVMSRQGTADKPITVRGIRNAKGEAPVLDAARASKPSGLDYWSEARGVIKIGASSNSGDLPPAHIVLENLNIQGAKPENFFLGKDGLTEYAPNASAIYVESGNHLTIRNCRLHDCGNGLFVAPASEEVLVEGCDIYDNGIEGSILEHNVYTESKGIVFQFNRLGPLRTGCRGNNLKDRSAGLIIRYNRIESGNRQLDLVDSQEGLDIRNDPRYHLAQVYGNLLIEHEGIDNNQIVHFGGDSGDDEANRRSLQFYNNTILSTRTEKTVLFKLSTNRQSADVWNNVIFTPSAGSTFAILDEEGQVRLRGNFIKPGWRKSHGQLKGEIIATGMIEGEDPGFANLAQDDFQPSAKSALRDQGVDAQPRSPAVEFEPPWLNRPGVKRPVTGRIDIGCYEGR